MLYNWNNPIKAAQVLQQNAWVSFLSIVSDNIFKGKYLNLITVNWKLLYVTKVTNYFLNSVSWYSSLDAWIFSSNCPHPVLMDPLFSHCNSLVPQQQSQVHDSATYVYHDIVGIDNGRVLHPIAKIYITVSLGVLFRSTDVIKSHLVNCQKIFIKSTHPQKRLTAQDTKQTKWIGNIKKKWKTVTMNNQFIEEIWIIINTQKDFKWYE